jgi:hypothetical protein
MTKPLIAQINITDSETGATFPGILFRLAPCSRGGVEATDIEMFSYLVADVVDELTIKYDRILTQFAHARAEPEDAEGIDRTRRCYHVLLGINEVALVVKGFLSEFQNVTAKKPSREVDTILRLMDRVIGMPLFPG